MNAVLKWIVVLVVFLVLGYGALLGSVFLLATTGVASSLATAIISIAVGFGAGAAGAVLAYRYIPATPTPLECVFTRELGGYFATPVAYVFIVIFLILTGVFTFNFGNFFERGQADLQPFFTWHPWLYLFLIPAVSMRLWAEERKSGTIELLLTLPLSLGEAVLGKFLAAWAFCGIALALTFPMWITVNVLGEPDNGAIVAAYLGSLLMAGGFLAIGSLVSASTKSQVIAFVVTVVVCLGFLLAGFPPVLDAFSGWAPRWAVEAISSFSFLTHFGAISRGVVAAGDLVFFVSLIACFLVGAAVVIEMKKA